MIDTTRILGRGLSMPLRRRGSDLVAASGVDAVRASIEQILITRKGEIAWRPDFGANLERIRHRNITPTLLAEIEADIQQAIITYEPRAVLTSVTVTQLTVKRTQLVVKVKWRAQFRSNNGNTVISEEQTTEVTV